MPSGERGEARRETPPDRRPGETDTGSPPPGTQTFKPGTSSARGGEARAGRGQAGARGAGCAGAVEASARAPDAQPEAAPRLLRSLSASERGAGPPRAAAQVPRRSGGERATCVPPSGRSGPRRRIPSEWFKENPNPETNSAILFCHRQRRTQGTAPPELRRRAGGCEAGIEARGKDRAAGVSGKWPARLCGDRCRRLCASPPASRCWTRSLLQSRSVLPCCQNLKTVR